MLDLGPRLRRVRGHTNDYYHCTSQELWQEVERRGYSPLGGHDELSEGLTRDDHVRGTGATTVTTVTKECAKPRSKRQMAEYGKAIDPSQLVGERITHWKMNTFFPTLQLFFESGFSCTIEGGQLRDSSVGIDSDLRFRLTDLTHEENGRITQSILPEKFPGSIKILECVVAERNSVSIKSVAKFGIYSSTRIEQEAHMVIGLRLEGMTGIGYVWARVNDPPGDIMGRTWGDTTIGGFRDDIPAPVFDFYSVPTKMGRQISIVRKESMMSRNRKPADIGARRKSATRF